MTDLQIIKSTYASLSDGQLLFLYEVEKEGLTKEAIVLLKAEISKRNIDLCSHSNIDYSYKHTSHQLYSNASVFSHILENNEKGMDDSFIVGGLLERGLNEEEAQSMMNQFPVYIESRIQKSSGQILTGVVLFVSGLSISFLPLSHETQKAIYILAYTLVITGVLRLFHGYTNKRRFLKIKQHKINNNVKNQTDYQR